jgi:replicative DNA helicase
MASSTGRPVPYNIDAEESTLASLMLDSDAITQILPFLKKDDFYREKHQWIYEALIELHTRNEPADLVTVADQLERQNRLADVGGAVALSALQLRLPTAIHVEHYGRIVERTAILRRLIGAAERIAKMAYDESEKEVGEIIERAERELFAVSQHRLTGAMVSLKDILGDFYKTVEQLYMHRQTVGLQTGFTDLDRLLGGFQAGDLIILAARPSMGKTSLALSLVESTSLKFGARVAFFSLEMGVEQLAQRLVSSQTGIDMKRLRVGPIYEEDLERVGFAVETLSKTQIFIDETPAITPLELRTKARRVVSEYGLDLIVIDYLQLMSSGRGNENRVQEVAYISRTLKELARELKVPVIALSQLSRGVESRQDKRPMLSDLRDSGCLAGESLVYLPDEGIYRRIDELVGQRGFNVLALNTESWQFESRPVTNAFSTGRKPVYKLTTQLGRSIRATGNHKFLTIEANDARTEKGWQPLSKLREGMRIALPRELPIVQSDELLALAQSDVYWDKIASIEADGEAEVYDLTVEGLHNFVSNNIYVHNSIEQDADIVMFIYRDVVYNKDTERPNIAEVIVSKHRNGPTGIVELRFSKENAKFSDLETGFYDDDDEDYGPPPVALEASLSDIIF